MNELEQGSRILIGVDGSTGSRAAAAWTLAQAAFYHAESEAVYAWQLTSLAFSAPGFVAPTHDEIDVEGRATFDRTMADLVVPADVKVKLRVCDGPPAEVLRVAAGDPDVRMVVVGSQGHGAMTEFLLGSVSHGLTHHCPRPLVIVHCGTGNVTAGARPAPPAERRVVVGVDGSPDSLVALRWAAAEAAATDASLQVAVAWSESKALFPTKFALGGSLAVSLHAAAEGILDEALRTLDSPGLRIERAVVEGRPAKALIELAASADLLVVGRRGLGRAQEALHGSVSHTCAHRSPIPVAIVPHVG
jgi:nucleotide-binding universal stress UspA family protein